jgi:hypothetical protein
MDGGGFPLPGDSQMAKYRFVKENFPDGGCRFFTEIFLPSMQRWAYCSGTISRDQKEAKRYFENLVVGEATSIEVLEERERE